MDHQLDVMLNIFCTTQQFVYYQDLQSCKNSLITLSALIAKRLKTKQRQEQRQEQTLEMMMMMTTKVKPRLNRQREVAGNDDNGKCDLTI